MKKGTALPAPGTVVTEGEREGARKIKKARIVMCLQQVIELGDPTANQGIR